MQMGFCENSERKLENKNTAFFNLIYIHKKDSTLDLVEHYIRRGIEISQQIENDTILTVLSRSLLALIYSKKGQWNEALAIAEEAYHDALAQKGMVAPICEIFLSSILLESGDHKQARKHLENSATLLLKLNTEASLVKGSKRENFGVNREAVCWNRKDSYLFRIQMFGPIRVFYWKQELGAASWRTVKSRHLLAYLAHQDKPVSTDQILEDLWPHFDLDRASALFHTTLYYLRRLLQQFTHKEIIIRGSKRYQLRPGSVVSDRFQFEERSHIALEKEMTAALAEELEATVLLYRGDYLEDLDYQWVIPTQERLRNLLIELRRKLAGYYLHNKMYSRALIHLHQLMELIPYSESILKLLLTALAEKGDQLAVKKQYELFSKTIAEELGLQPSSEMAKFFAFISKKNMQVAF